MNSEREGPLGDTDAQVSLRDTALWYPDIPHPALSFLGVPEKRISKPPPPEEVPFSFEIFGGLSGESTSDVTNIAVRTREFGDCLDTLSIAVNFRNRETAAELGLQGAETAPSHDFTIDGPGGERITSLDKFHAYGSLLGFKVCLGCSLVAFCK